MKALEESPHRRGTSEAFLGYRVRRTVEKRIAADQQAAAADSKELRALFLELIELITDATIRWLVEVEERDAREVFAVIGVRSASWFEARQRCDRIVLQLTQAQREVQSARESRTEFSTIFVEPREKDAVASLKARKKGAERDVKSNEKNLKQAHADANNLTREIVAKVLANAETIAQQRNALASSIQSALEEKQAAIVEILQRVRSRELALAKSFENAAQLLRRGATA